MLIQFSTPRDYPRGLVAEAAAPIIPAFKWASSIEVRFTLPGATTAQHESVILALLTLDPRATIRTSRARYVGLADYQRQIAGKKSGMFTD